MKKQIEGQLDFFELLEECRFLSDMDDSFSEDEFMEDGSVEENHESNVEIHEKINTDILFKECDLCWCKDCRHNEKNEGIERDFGGIKKPCFPCSFCIENKNPEICEIGSAKNGCKLRAEEENII